MRIAVVISASAIAGDATESMNGHNPRCLTLIQALQPSHDILLLRLESGTGDGSPETSTLIDSTRSVYMPSLQGTRGDRFIRLGRRLIGSSFPSRWERDVCAELEAFKCDVVLVLTYRSLDIARTISGRFQTALFVEEEFADGCDPWGVSPGAVGRFEYWALKRSIRRVSRVVVISAAEKNWAEDAFSRPTFVIPHSVDVDYWTRRDAIQNDTNYEFSDRDVFVIGNLSRYADAKGLRDILEEIARHPQSGRPRILLACGTKPHTLLDEFSEDILEWVGPVTDPRPFYDSVKTALVPAFHVKGAKTTVLQGWAAGCAIVATNAAAASVGGVDGYDLLAGGTPQEVVQKIYQIFDDSALREQLTVNGRDSYEERHSVGAIQNAIEHLFRDFPWYSTEFERTPAGRE